MFFRKCKLDHESAGNSTELSEALIQRQRENWEIKFLLAGMENRRKRIENLAPKMMELMIRQHSFTERDPQVIAKMAVGYAEALDFELTGTTQADVDKQEARLNELYKKHKMEGNSP